jgi:hypothetical protein
MQQRSSNYRLKPYLERISFSNTRLEKLERGDILYFGYAGSREDTIINPAIIFSGIDTKTGFIHGVNMRMFYVDKMLNLGNAALKKYGDIYWDEVENEEDDSITLEKKKVNYTATTAFQYDTLGLYKMATMNKVVNGARKQINLMEQYWRSYQPIKMRLLNDEFSKLSNNNISINLQVLNAIMHVAPKQVVLQTRIEA